MEQIISEIYGEKRQQINAAYLYKWRVIVVQKDLLAFYFLET